MKRWLLGLAAVIVVVAVAYIVLNRADTAAGAAPALAGAPPAADVLARGEYLTTAADCAACHTEVGSAGAFAGGVAFRLPFGTIYSTNITADPDTGIGRWSDDEFVRAVREGIRNDGQHLYPALPYTSYTQMSRADVLAIRSYLKSLPAVKQENKANDLSFPFNQRWAMGFWNAAFFKSQRFAADESKSAQWNSGAYLAVALGHCAECHTPRNVGFGLEHGKELSGEELQGWRAYNITSDPRYGIGSWSDADLAAYMKSGHAAEHASAAGPMGEAVGHSLQYLNSEDVAALVVYLRGVPAREGKGPIAVDATPAPALASSNMAPGNPNSPEHAQGLRLFEGACASCHQWNGKGQQTPYASLLGTRGVNDATGTNVTQAILQGVNLRLAENNVYMPAFGSAYTDTEVAALANFVIAQFGGKDGSVTPADVAKRRSL
jgi:mono/diheme cytochrome c family protein